MFLDAKLVSHAPPTHRMSTAGLRSTGSEGCDPKTRLADTLSLFSAVNHVDKAQRVLTDLCSWTFQGWSGDGWETRLASAASSAASALIRSFRIRAKTPLACRQVRETAAKAW